MPKHEKVCQNLEKSVSKHDKVYQKMKKYDKT